MTPAQPGAPAAQASRIKPDVSPEFVSAAIEAAEQSGPILRRYFRSSLSPTSKADESPVTIADREAEQALRSHLQTCFPDHGVLGEEFGADRQGASYCWVLDPIDGTRAFITGKPTFGTLIALLCATACPSLASSTSRHRRTLARHRRRAHPLHRTSRRHHRHPPMPDARGSRTLLHLAGAASAPANRAGNAWRTR